jgi:hypothetical protein
MVDSDVRALLCSAVKESAGRYAYVMYFTQSKVIYSKYDDVSGEYLLLQRSYDISSTRTVTLQDDVQEVVIMVEIMPKDSSRNRSRIMENNMPTDPKNNADPKAAPATTPATTTDQPKMFTQAEVDALVEQKTATAVQEALAANAAKAPKTTAEYLAAAPEEIRESIEHGLALHTERKNAVIQSILATNRSPYTEDELKAMNLPQIEKLAKLAAVPTPTFHGQALPKPQLVDNEAVPAMPELFPVAKPAAA